jgi:hypothetical protein
LNRWRKLLQGWYERLALNDVSLAERYLECELWAHVSARAGCSHDTKEFRRVSMAVLDIRLCHSVHISGLVGDPASDDITMQWLREVEDAAAATSRDGRERWVSGRVKGKMRVTLEEPKPGETLLEGA